MLDRRARGFAVILENQNVAEALVVFQVQHAVAVAPQHVFHGALRQRRQRRCMLRRFDDHFVRADAVHLVEETFAFAVQFAFDAQRRKFVGHHANAPAGRVGAAAVAAIDQNLRRRLRFTARRRTDNSSRSVAMTLSRRKSFGRFPRSVEMITHRPVIGSFRNSGNAILLEYARSLPREDSQ